MGKIILNVPCKFRITGEDLVQDKLLRILTDVVNDALKRASTNLKRRINPILVQNMQNHETFISLGSGKLQAEFGLTKDMAAKAQEGIIRILRDSTNIVVEKFRINKTSVTGKFEVNIIEADLQRFINLKSGAYVSQGVKNVHKYDIEWMKWLLTRGIDRIWQNHSIQYYNRMVPKSRQGYALMIEKTGGGGWAVPETYQGTLDNNFITDVAQKSEEAIADVVKNEIEINIE